MLDVKLLLSRGRPLAEVIHEPNSRLHNFGESDAKTLKRIELYVLGLQHACRRGHSAIYQRVPRLQEELRIRHGSGAFGKWLLQLAKTDVLVLDDWGMGAIDSTTRSDLLEVIDDRAANKATIITSQLPVEHWHAWIGDATIADAILDRIMQRHHRFTLTGDSLRTERPTTSKKEQTIDPS